MYINIFIYGYIENHVYTIVFVFNRGRWTEINLKTSVNLQTHSSRPILLERRKEIRLLFLFIKTAFELHLT